MAGALRAGGIRPGDRVAMLDLNSRWLLAAHYGVPGSGAALVALNSRLAAPEYRDILAHSRARVLLVSPALLPALAVSSADELPVETVVLLPGGQDPARPAGQDAALPGARPYGEWLAHADSRGIEPPGDEDAMIAVNYTSGTTGRPKGVVYTHRGAYLNAVSIALEFGLSASSWQLWTLPMFHCNGWSLTWGVTTVGGTHVCLPSFDADRALDLICPVPGHAPVRGTGGAQRAGPGGQPAQLRGGPAGPGRGGRRPAHQGDHRGGPADGRPGHAPVRADRDLRAVAGLRVPGRLDRSARRGAGRAAQPAGGTHRVRGRRAGG